MKPIDKAVNCLWYILKQTLNSRATLSMANWNVVTQDQWTTCRILSWINEDKLEEIFSNSILVK